MQIVAFLTVAVTVTDYTDIDLGRRLQIMGRVSGVQTSNFFPGYLVAQLARDDRYSHEDFDASELLPFAEEMMRVSVGVAGGRMAYLCDTQG